MVFVMRSTSVSARASSLACLAHLDHGRSSTTSSKAQAFRTGIILSEKTQGLKMSRLIDDVSARARSQECDVSQAIETVQVNVEICTINISDVGFGPQLCPDGSRSLPDLDARRLHVSN